MAFNSDEPEYWLGRNFLSSARLTYQHDLYVKRLGFLLHPDIAKAVGLADTSVQQSTAPLRVLDLGTGNGIWAIDFARSTVNSPRPVEITGLDISAEMFPIAQSRPDNVTFDTYDFFQDPPAHLLEKFDIIHIRFINPVLWQNSASKTTVMKNFTRMLNAGGWLQWMEPLPPLLRTVTFQSDGTPSVSEEMSSAEALLDEIVPVQRNSAWLCDLDKFMAEHGGYVHTMKFEPALRPDLITWEHVLIQWNLSEGLPNLFKALKDGPEKEKLMKAMADRTEQMNNGSRIVVGSYVVATGRKPDSG